jgi:hypothetical protein
MEEQQAAKMRKQTNTQKIEELKLMLSVLTSQTEKSRRDSLKISHQIIDNLFLLFDQKLKGINPPWSNVCPASEVQLHTHEECDFFFNQKTVPFFSEKGVIHTIGDCHIYLDHEESLRKQILRKPFKFPKLIINDKNSIEEYNIDDFIFTDYNYYEKISLKMAI